MDAIEVIIVAIKAVDAATTVVQPQQQIIMTQTNMITKKMNVIQSTKWLTIRYGNSQSAASMVIFPIWSHKHVLFKQAPLLVQKAEYLTWQEAGQILGHQRTR